MNLSKQEFLSVGDSAKYINPEFKRQLREELDDELSRFLASGGQIKTLPTGHSACAGNPHLFNKLNTASVEEAISKRVAKSKKEYNKTYYEKTKVLRTNTKSEAQLIREELQAEQKIMFAEWGAKAGHGDMKLLSEVTGVSKTALRSAFYGMTVLKKGNWDVVKRELQRFDFSVNQDTPKKRQPNRENVAKRRSERLDYLCKYQQERKLKAITQKYCGESA